MFKIGGITFDERERQLIGNCRDYYFGEPAGLPGHALMVLIAKMSEVYSVLNDMDFAAMEGYLDD